jgi:DNA-binding response OmpR family regulator
MRDDSGRERLRVGRLEIHPDEWSVTADGALLPLTVREFDLLVALARRQGRIVSRQELYAVVWGAPYRKSDRSVDVYIGKLRSKLEQALPGWRYIHTHFGFGYRFAPEPAQGGHEPANSGDPQPSSQLLHDSATRG